MGTDLHVVIYPQPRLPFYLHSLTLRYMNQSGFALISIILIAVGVLALGTAGWLCTRDVRRPRPHVQSAIIPSSQRQIATNPRPFPLSRSPPFPSRKCSRDSCSP